MSDYSTRFTYNSVGITPPGSDPHIVATNIRGSGLVLESDLSSVTASLAEFMTPRPLPVELRVKGQKWLNKQMLGHQWLWTTQPDQKTRVALITEALTKGPVCVSVSAWWKNDQGLFYSPAGVENEHWTMVYKIDETGIYVFDSYNDAQTNTNLKKLTLDHNIQFAKVYFFTTPTQQQNWLIALISAFLELVGLKEKQAQLPVIPMPVIPSTPPLSTEKYDWSNVAAVKHSVRVICDEEKLSVRDKNDMCATIEAESEFKLNAKRENFENGKVWSTDWGICQWNDYYHGQEITPDEAVHNPEKAVRLMAHYWKRGEIYKVWWIAYKNGSYKQYL